VEYNEFLKTKMCIDDMHGFEINQNEINSKLYPHQRDIAQWAIKGGRRAIFAAFGLGKSFMQLEILRIIKKREDGRQLIIAPLGVRQEFKIDAKKLNIKIRFIRRSEEVIEDSLYITNYESVRDGRLDINLFNGVSLDEASVLRSYGSKTFQQFLTIFQDIKYRFVATATPSPNKYKELIHYAGFLGVMDTGQALTRFFQRDSTQANNLTLYPHMENEFWLWISSWAIFLQKPSDLGYSDEGYDLPKLNIFYHELKSQSENFVNKDGQISMFSDSSMSLQMASKEKRESIKLRVEKAAEIILQDPDEHFILWHDREAERHELKKAISGVIDVYGSQDLDKREQRIIDFSNGKFKYLATKPILSGSGCNLQRYCHNSIFVGIGFKFNELIQAIHRIHRFLQKHECNIHLIFTNRERTVLKILLQKWENHKKMVKKMADIIKKYGLSHSEMAQELKRAIGIERLEVSGERFTLANNDCVDETKLIEDNSVGMICTSIPFANHYEYTPSYNDFGHTKSNGQFWNQMDFVTPDLLRILKPGRIYACHVKDRILFGNATGKGVPTVSPFHMEATFHAMKHGFDYLGMITVVTDVVRENNQTYRLGWTEQCKDGTKMGVGSPEYVLILRKPQTDRTRAYADEPVVKTKVEYHKCPNCDHVPKKGEEIMRENSGQDPLLYGFNKLKWLCNKCETYQHFEETGGYSRARWQVDAHDFWRSSGNRLLTYKELESYGPDILCTLFTQHTLENIYDYEAHVKVGEALELRGKLPASFMAIAPGSHDPNVWHDVNRMLTLNSSQKRRNVQMHVCPLQFDIVDRLITRYSNKDDLIYDPFCGIGTVPLRALKLGRRGRGSELNTNYFLDSVKYLQAEERNAKQMSLFDFENIDSKAA